MASGGFGVRAQMGTSTSSEDSRFSTLIEYMGNGGVDAGDDLVVLFDHIQYACKRIAAFVASPLNSSLSKGNSVGGGAISSDSDAPKPLDLVSNEIILYSLRKSGKVAVMSSEEDDAPFVVVTYPLDGSRNIDASIPTGTIFGIYKHLAELDHLPQEEKAILNSLQSGTKLVASGYVLFSSATTLPYYVPPSVREHTRLLWITRLESYKVMVMFNRK